MKATSTTGGRTNSSNIPERTLQEYLAVIYRGKWTILIVFGAVLVLTILFTKLTEPTYKATAQVLLNTKELQSTTLFLDAGRMEGPRYITQNELAILNSRSLADSVAMKLIRKRYLDEARGAPILIIQPSEEKSSEGSVAPLAQISGRLSGAIDFEPVRESDIIIITAKSMDPVEAALIANTFAESYRDRNIYMSRAKTRSFREFLETQAQEKRRALEETESSLQDYMENQGIVSLDDESKKVIDQLSQLEATRDATDISLKQLEKTLALYTGQLPQQETDAAREIGEAHHQYIRQLQEELAKLEVQRDVTVVQNPSSVGREIIGEKLREIDSRINSLRLKLQKRTDEFLQTLTPSQGGIQTDAAAGYLKSVKQKIIEAETEVQSLKTKKKALEEVIRDYEKQFERIPQKSVRLARLQRARLSNEKLFLLIEEKYNEANITEQSNIGYVEIIEPASVPVSPASPKFLINLALGIVLGLGLGIGFVFVKEYVDVRIETPEELKRRGFVPLTAIMNMNEEISRLGGHVKAPTQEIGVRHLISFSYPFSSIAESFRQLRTNLQFAKLGHPNRTILVTSPLAGEGKSTVISNLAIAFAQGGKKVLLIDADLRRPSIDAEFNLKREPGLSELLLGKAMLKETLQNTGVENLSFICSGLIPPNPAEVLGSEKMREFVEHAKRSYEVILLDSSPVLAVTDPSVLSTLTDGVILVVTAGQTRFQELEQATEMLERVEAKILGVVVNKFDPHRAYGISYRRAMSGYYGYATSYATRGRNGEQTAEQRTEKHG